jgi:hypothetical protein
MVVSSRFGADGAIVNCCPLRFWISEAFGRLKPIPREVNETGMFVSKKVHVREIVVIWGGGCLAGRLGAFRRIACRSPKPPI